MQHLHHFNFLAILVSAVILWVLGAAWYSPPLFAKPWMAALGITPDPTNKKGLVPGMIAWAIISIWFLYRIVRGWMNLNANKPMETA